jgi:hypothetical protein
MPMLLNPLKNKLCSWKYIKTSLVKFVSKREIYHLHIHIGQELALGTLGDVLIGFENIQIYPWALNEVVIDIKYHPQGFE